LKTKTLLICIALPLLGGAASALITGGGFSDFNTAVKPPFSPPAWLFPVVWSVLYILMGTASYLVIASDNKKSPAAIKVYGAQLLFNLLWPFWFFDLKAYLFSFAWLIALLLLVILTTIRFWRISKPAGILFLPYIAWLLIAGYLNIGIAILN